MKKRIIISVIFAILVTAVVALSDFVPDVIVTSPNGIWTDTRAYNTIDAAITAVGTNDRDIYIVRQEATTALTVSSNVSLHFFASGSIANTGQLTLNTRQIFAGDHQIFTGTGDIDFSPGSVIRSAWFSSIVEAFNLTTDDNISLIISKSAFVTFDCSVGNNVNLRWEAPNNRLTINSGITLSNIGNIEAGNFQLFAGAGDFDFLDGSIVHSSWFARLRSAISFTTDEDTDLTILVDQPETIDLNTSTDIHQTLEVSNGSIINVTAGNTFTINGNLKAGLYQISSGAGLFTLSNSLVNSIYTEWFGSDPTGTSDSSSAIHKAIISANGKVIKLVGTYKVTTLDDTDVSVDLNLIGDKESELNGSDDIDAGFKLSGTNLSIYVEGIRFNNMGSTAAFYCTTSDTFSQVTFKNNEFISSTQGIYLPAVMYSVIITNNRFDTLARAGSCNAIYIGESTYANQDSEKRFIISNNVIHSIIASAAGETHGIFAQGREIIVSGNEIDTVKNTSDTGNTEAIYVKAKFFTVSDNIIIDGAQDALADGAISVKGQNRATVTGLQTYSGTVHDNIVYDSTGAYTGISIHSEDIRVYNNILEGQGEYAIVTIDNKELDNIVIDSNVIRNFRGSAAIQINHYGSGTKIFNNHIHGLLGTQGTPTNVYGIFVNSDNSTLNDWEISNNSVLDYSESAASSSVRGINLFIGSGKTANDIRINNNKVKITSASVTEYGIVVSVSGTLSGLQIHGNGCDGVPEDTGYPFIVYNPTNISSFDITNNKFYELNTSRINLEFYHTNIVRINDGAVGTQIPLLPVAQVGLRFKFIRTDSQTLRIDPDGSDTIRGGGAGKYLELDTDGDSVTLECFVANEWEIIAGYGTYAYEP